MIVVDTHILIWWVSENRSRLSSVAHKAVEEALRNDSAYASSITAWEIAMLVRKRKLDLSVSVSEWLDGVSKVAGLNFLPVNNAVAVQSLELPGEFHDDPADRIIVALARELSASLVTADEKIRRYPHVQTIW